MGKKQRTVTLALALVAASGVVLYATDTHAWVLGIAIAISQLWIWL